MSQPLVALEGVFTSVGVPSITLHDAQQQGSPMLAQQVEPLDASQPLAALNNNVEPEPEEGCDQTGTSPKLAAHR